MVIDIEQMVPENAFARVLKKAMDCDWLIKQVKPYFPDARDAASPPIRALALIMMEHLKPYGLRYVDKPFLWSVYTEWSTSFSYMWLLEAVPSDIPPFEDVFYPVYDKLPAEVLHELLRHILTNCIRLRAAAEYSDEVLYYTRDLNSEEQAAEAERLARSYTEQFYREIDAYRDSATAQEEQKYVLR